MSDPETTIKRLVENEVTCMRSIRRKRGTNHPLYHLKDIEPIRCRGSELEQPAAKVDTAREQLTRMDFDTIDAGNQRGPLSNLPDRGVTNQMIEQLSDSGRFEYIFPLGGHLGTTVKTHIVFYRNDVAHFVGWNPDTETWDRLAEVTVLGDGDYQLRLEQLLDDDGTVLLEPSGFYRENADGTVENVFEGTVEYVAEAGRISYTDIGMQPPEFYTEQIHEALTELDNE